MKNIVHTEHETIARTCLEAAEANTMGFPQIVRALTEAGFEGYTIDFRRGCAIYYRPGGETVEFPTHRLDVPVAPVFNIALMQAAIREAQQQVQGYTYKGFCEKAALAGCASYVVSFPGRRVIYIGRTAEVHVEHFPNR